MPIKLSDDELYISLQAGIQNINLLRRCFMIADQYLFGARAVI